MPPAPGRGPVRALLAAALRPSPYRLYNGCPRVLNRLLTHLRLSAWMHCRTFRRGGHKRTGGASVETAACRGRRPGCRGALRCAGAARFRRHACTQRCRALQELLAGGQDAPGFAVVLLDLGLPDQDGFEVCGKIRRTSSTPVIMVTARADVRSRIHGLNLGADDYVVKPYDMGELLARIHAVSRRRTGEDGAGAPESGARDTASAGGTAGKAGGADHGTLRLGGVTIELPTRQVSVDGSEVSHPKGVRSAGTARPAARRRLPQGTDHQRGLAHELGGHGAHPRGTRRLAARQAPAVGS